MKLNLDKVQVNLQGFESKMYTSGFIFHYSNQCKFIVSDFYYCDDNTSQKASIAYWGIICKKYAFSITSY